VRVFALCSVFLYFFKIGCLGGRDHLFFF
jgi:hypothetical protein